MYKVVTLAGGIREPLLTCSSLIVFCDNVQTGWTPPSSDFLLMVVVEYVSLFMLSHSVNVQHQHGSSVMEPQHMLLEIRKIIQVVTSVKIYVFHLLLIVIYSRTP